jgi:hypothetical protein
MSIRLTRGTAAALILLASHLAGGQMRLDSLPRGARVRVLAPAAGVIWPAKAIFDSVSVDTVFVHDLSDPPELRRMTRVAIPMSGLRRVEVPIPGRGHWVNARRGAVWGLATYLAFAAAYIVHEHATCRGPDCFGEGLAWVGLIGSVPVAVGAGATVGFVLPVRQWRRVTLPQR